MEHYCKIRKFNENSISKLNAVRVVGGTSDSKHKKWIHCKTIG